jgi:hypothetical protein
LTEPPGNPAGGRRFVWHAIALLLAAAVAWLIFASYRQPDLMLDLAGMRLCAEHPPATSAAA